MLYNCNGLPTATKRLLADQLVGYGPWARGKRPNKGGLAVCPLAVDEVPTHWQAQFQSVNISRWLLWSLKISHIRSQPMNRVNKKPWPHCWEMLGVLATCSHPHQATEGHVLLIRGLQKGLYDQRRGQEQLRLLPRKEWSGCLAVMVDRMMGI